jgi:hypothetical protein
MIFGLDLPFCGIFGLYGFCKVLIINVLNDLQGRENINWGVGGA